MAEPSDLLDKLADSKEVAIGLVNDLSNNPVTFSEEAALCLVMDVCNLLRSASRKTEQLIEGWPQLP